MMPYVWLVVIVVMSLMEALTAQMVSIWFVVGGVASLVVSLFTDSILIQMLVFIFITAITLLLTRPLVKKVMTFKKEDTNVGRYIGKTGIVTVDINNEIGLGQVNVGGNIWTARSSDESIIPSGSNVTIERVEGVKLIVSSIKK